MFILSALSVAFWLHAGSQVRACVRVFERAQRRERELSNGDDTIEAQEG